MKCKTCNNETNITSGKCLDCIFISESTATYNNFIGLESSKKDRAKVEIALLFKNKPKWFQFIKMYKFKESLKNIKSIK